MMVQKEQLEKKLTCLRQEYHSFLKYCKECQQLKPKDIYSTIHLLDMELKQIRIERKLYEL